MLGVYKFWLGYLQLARTFGSPPRAKNSKPAASTNSSKLEWVANLTLWPYSCTKYQLVSYFLQEKVSVLQRWKLHGWYKCTNTMTRTLRFNGTRSHNDKDTLDILLLKFTLGGEVPFSSNCQQLCYKDTTDMLHLKGLQSRVFLQIPI